MRIAASIGGLALGLSVLAGCGDDGGQFDDRVAAVRSAIDSGDRAAAETALDELAFVAGAAVDEGSISQAEGEEVAALVASSRSLLDEVLPTTTTTTTTTTAPPAPEPDRDTDDEDADDKGKKKGHDKDRDGDDEDDD